MRVLMLVVSVLLLTASPIWLWVGANLAATYNSFPLFVAPLLASTLVAGVMLHMAESME